MVTITKINQILSQLNNQKLSSDIDEKLLKKINHEIDFNNKVLIYLETNPSLEYCEKEKLRLDGLIKTIEAKYSEWIEWNKSKVDPKKWQSEFNSTYDLPKYKNQLKTINYILYT